MGRWVRIRACRVACVLVCFGALVGGCGAVDQTEPDRRVCLLPEWEGFLAGYSHIDDVSKVFGVEIRRQETGFLAVAVQPEAGGYCTVFEGVDDRLVSQITVMDASRKGDSGAAKCDAARSPRAPKMTRFGMILFGATTEFVRSSLGAPNQILKRDDGAVQWNYLSMLTCETELDTGVSYVFVGGELREVIFWSDLG